MADVEQKDVANFIHLEDTLTVEVLRIIKDSQLQHGLRHDDYQRYRQYCTRRIRRIRKSLHFPQGRRDKIIPKKVTVENLTDVRFLHLVLFDAERAWAVAMQLRIEANSEPRKKFHLLNKLRKAVQHAVLLETLAQDVRVDARTKLESKAYSDWMKATLYFEQENWKECMHLFDNAKTIYERLSDTFVDEVKEQYLQKVKEIAPNLRYCAYRIGDESAVNDLKHMRQQAGIQGSAASMLDKLIVKTREKQTITLSEITWRSRTVPVKNEQVRLCLLSANELTSRVEAAETDEAKLSVYETMLKEFIDAQGSLREDHKDDQTFRAALRGTLDKDKKVSNDLFLYTHLAYLRQKTTVQRNLLMIKGLRDKRDVNGRLPKPQDAARLYDVIIMNLKEILNLPGFDDDAQLSLEISADILLYSAFRCYYAAETYAAAKKWSEASALYEQVLLHVDRAQDSIAKTQDKKSNDVKVKQDELKKLSQLVDGVRYTCRASAIIEKPDVSDSAKTDVLDKPLSERIETYNENLSFPLKDVKLTTFPPEFKPIPAKPLFYDVALNHVKFPSLEEETVEARPGAKSAGVYSYVKSWFGGSKK